MMRKLTILDCTLRDGGYYNNWDFDSELIEDYLQAMVAMDVDFVEIGFRFLNNEEFKGGCAFSTDSYLASLSIPLELECKIGVMINGADILPKDKSISVQAHQQAVLCQLFADKEDSPVSLVRIACHAHEFVDCLPASNWLKSKGYLVGFNVMQVADQSEAEIGRLAKCANEYPIDALYFADSMGSLDPERTGQIVKAFKEGWRGELGIHTHDNMGQALVNTLQAVKAGVTWVDSTVTGMGRGPGNVQTEYLALALSESRPQANLTKLLELISKHFKPLQAKYGWGKNPYYYLAGKYSIHPTYIQEVLSDSRYNDEDILAVIDHLKVEGGKKFSLDTLDTARRFYIGEPRGAWKPVDIIKGKEVLILGSGPGVARHKKAIENYIQQNRPFVIALNTQSGISQKLIDIRAACHPVRLLADCREHLSLPQPLVVPASMLLNELKDELVGKELLDFGISVEKDSFDFSDSYCVLPNTLVLAYVLAMVNSGQASKVFLAGFDGYGADDPRRKEIDRVFHLYQQNKRTVKLYAVTQTRYEVPVQSIYGLGK